MSITAVSHCPELRYAQRNSPKAEIQKRGSVMMDEDSRKHIAGLEKNSRFPTGIGRIERGECPCEATSPITCTFCAFGHMLECHHPFTCEEAECSHYQQEMEYEDD